jgi:hypothetical protein
MNYKKYFQESTTEKTESYVTDRYVLLKNSNAIFPNIEKLKEGENFEKLLTDKIIEDKILLPEEKLKSITRDLIVIVRYDYLNEEVFCGEVGLDIKYYTLIMEIYKMNRHLEVKQDKNNNANPLLLFFDKDFVGAVSLKKN